MIGGGGWRAVARIAAALVVIALALAALMLGEIDPLLHLQDRREAERVERDRIEMAQGRHATWVARIRAVQAHRSEARRCVDAIASMAPEFVSAGLPTMVFVSRAPCSKTCASAMGQSAWIHERMRPRGVRIVWAETGPGGPSPVPSIRRVEAPACTAMLGETLDHDWLVLDREGGVFAAGGRENDLKFTLWVPDPNAVTSPHFTLGGQGRNVLLDSGGILFEEEAVLMTTWANRCKWYFGQCLFVDGQHRAARRLDVTPADDLAREGDAEIRKRGYLR